MERGGRRSRDENGALAGMHQWFRCSAWHAPDKAEARGCARAVPPLQAAGRRSAARIGQPGQSRASAASRAAPPHPRPFAESRRRARARSPITLWRWETRNCARQCYRPIARLFRLPCGPAPGAGALTAAAARVFCALGITEGGSVPVGERWRESWMPSGPAAQTNRAPVPRLGNFSTAPQARGLLRAGVGFMQ